MCDGAHWNGNCGNVTKTTTDKQERSNRFCGAWMNYYEIIISFAQVGGEALAHFVSHKMSFTNEVRGNNVLPSHHSTNRDRRKGILSTCKEQFSLQNAGVLKVQSIVLILSLLPRCDFYLNQLLHRYQCNNLCQCPHCCVLLPVQANIGKVPSAGISSHYISLTCLLQLCRSVLLNQFWPTLKSMWTYYSMSTHASKM